MKTLLCLIPVAMLAIPRVAAQTATYTNYIRQYQTPSNVTWDCSETVDPYGSKPSALAMPSAWIITRRVWFIPWMDPDAS